MATREFTVSARITADTASAQRNTRALAKANDELGDRLDRLRARFDAGEISGEKFLRGQAAIERQSVRLRKAVEQSGSGADRAQSSFSRFGEFLRARFVVTLGDVTRAARATFAVIEESGRRLNAERALRTQIDDLDAYLAKLQEVSDGTISNAALIASSSQALLLGIPADKISELLEIARGAAVATGESVEKAFDDIVRGIGRASPLILDNLGLVVRLEESYQKFAEESGKVVSELTEEEKKRALLNDVIDSNIDKYRSLTEVQSEATTAIDRSKAALDDFSTIAGTLATGVLQSLAAGVVGVVFALSQLGEGFVKVLGAMTSVLRQTPFVGKAFDGMAKSLKEADDSLDGFQARALRMIQDLDAGARASFGFGESADASANAVRRFEERVTSAGTSVTSYRDELDKLSGELEKADEATVRVASSTGELAQTAPVTAGSLASLGQQAVITATAFDRLAAAQGRAAAIQQALAGGATLTQGGTRIRLPGGSRLTRDAGFGGASRNQSRLFPGLSTII